MHESRDCTCTDHIIEGNEGGGWGVGNGCAHIKHILWLQDQRFKDSWESSFKTVRLRDRQVHMTEGSGEGQSPGEKEF